jgi:serine/threonine-protein kinase RsbW
VADPMTTDSGPEQVAESDDGLVSSAPPSRYTVVRTWTLDSASQLTSMRAEILREITSVGGVPQDELGPVAHHMVLVASELATNALEHGKPPTIVRLLGDGSTYLLDVADHDLNSTPYVAGARIPGNGGFGLQIARRLSIDVGWYTAEATKHVWAMFPAQG